MTIIKHSSKANYICFACLLGFLLITGGVLYISSYTVLVETRHRLRDARAEIEESKTAIADLQGELFRATDTASLREFAESKGLIAETKPRYFYYIR